MQNKGIAQSTWLSCLNDYKNNYERLVLEVGLKAVTRFMLQSQDKPQVIPNEINRIYNTCAGVEIIPDDPNIPPKNWKKI